MNQQDAAKILSISGTVAIKDIKQAYRKAALQYHPDKNPAGAEMMKLINAAFDVLKDFEGELSIGDDEQDYSHEVNIALNCPWGIKYRSVWRLGLGVRWYV